MSAIDGLHHIAGLFVLLSTFHFWCILLGVTLFLYKNLLIFLPVYICLHVLIKKNTKRRPTSPKNVDIKDRPTISS